MLTAFQVEVIAYSTPWGEIFCADCTTKRLEQDGGAGVDGFEPMIRYTVDEEQSEQARDYDWTREADPDAGPLDEDQDLNEYHSECAPAVICDACFEELVEAYHYHPEQS